MKKEIVHVLPYFEERMWGGTRLRDEFGYKTSVNPIGEVYNIVALKNHADCVIGNYDMTLSELFTRFPAWFDCDTDVLPIRVNILDPIADLSIQLHPGDEYAQKHHAQHGKPEAWVILDTPEDGYIEFGHHATSREQFAELAREKKWDQLFRYIPAKKDWYIDIPVGTLHAIGKNVLTYNISRNADCTYRLYDYDRINPTTGHQRDLHVQEVIDNVRIPDESNNFVWFDSSMRQGCEITEYWDEPGLYTLKRIKVDNAGTYEQERFAFLTVYEGAGAVNGVPLKKGESVLAPAGTGVYRFTGKLDLFLATYKNK